MLEARISQSDVESSLSSVLHPLQRASGPAKVGVGACVGRDVAGPRDGRVDGARDGAPVGANDVRGPGVGAAAGLRVGLAVGANAPQQLVEQNEPTLAFLMQSSRESESSESQSAGLIPSGISVIPV